MALVEYIKHMNELVFIEIFSILAGKYKWTF